MPDYDSQSKSYDLLYQGYCEDIPFYLSEAKKARGPVLEIGCGTGRLLLKFLQAGVDAHGIDISPGMISRLIKKAKALGMAAEGRAKVADMRNFSSRRKFALIIVPFRVFLHLLSSDDQLSSLACMRRSLSPHGRIIMNFFLPSSAFIAKNYGKRVSWVAYHDRAHLGRSKGLAEKGLRAVDYARYIDEPNQAIKVSQSLYRGQKRVARYDYRLSLVYKKEFELLLRLAGFSRWRVYGGFKKKRLVSSKQEMVWVIDK